MKWESINKKTKKLEGEAASETTASMKIKDRSICMGLVEVDVM